MACRSVDTKEHPVRLEGRYSHPVIVADISRVECIDESVMEKLDFHVAAVNDPVYGDMLRAGERAPEIIYTEALGPELTKLPDSVTVVVPYEMLDVAHVYNRKAVALIGAGEFIRLSKPVEGDCVFVELCDGEFMNADLARKLEEDKSAVVVLTLDIPSYSLYREYFGRLERLGIENRVVVRLISGEEDLSALSLSVAANLGGLFLDRLGYGLWLSFTRVPDAFYGVQLSRDILQSAGVRRYKTEFISCPGCGRTLYNLQESVARVKKAFGHLSRLKIAVMGCVVNGPGEMGDADYGYVGAGNGKVNLFRGKEMVRVGVPEDEAIEALKQLIVESGDWND